MRKVSVLSIFFAVALGLSACSGLTQQEQQALSGGAIGAAGGAVVGALAGNPAIGAAIGGAAGTATGALWDDIKDRVDN
ncbi:MAG: YMGG-like glycine zipper-containing protein [Pseudomonadota bacterium]